MATLTFAFERTLAASPEVVYHCIRDYTRHHRTAPEGFLPATFTHLEVLQGGVGAGTVFRFTTRVGGRSVTRTQTVSEPAPGHVLIESGDGEGSTFTVEPRGDGTYLRIETVLRASGLEGWLMPLLFPPVLKKLYAEEVASLERYAQAHDRSCGLPSEAATDTRRAAPAAS
jgi:hypothetical protein